MGRPPKPPQPRAHNPIRSQREIRAPTPILHKPIITAAARPPKRLCPNKECSDPKIVEGVCHSCGTVVDDSNIVAEISFGEDSRGANIALGSFVGEGQGAARNMGPAFRRVAGGGGEATSRDATINEGRLQMNGFVSQLAILSVALDQGLQIFKLAASTNFIQGRRIDMVAAVCLYTACRKNSPCNVMLIDFAEKLQVNVFKLGHTFKSLHRAITVSKEDVAPIVPEDLIYRFAMKLEFGELTVKVADTAIKLAKRMSIDWMVMGRRPSGVCGACLIVAARMHNFRRTVTEVVYIVKVTTATIQKRLDEFKLTPASVLSVEEFLNHNENHAGAAHDPPSFYEKQEEFIKNKKTRKRKRRGQLLEDDEDENQEGDEADPKKRQKTSTPYPDEALPTVELRRDADGFAIPPQPLRPQSESGSEFADIIDETAENPTDDALQKLAAKFLPTEGNVSTSDNEDEDDGGSSTASTTTTPKLNRQRKRRDDREIAIPTAWTEEETEIADMIRETLGDPKLAELVSDPNTKYHRLLYDMAEKKTQRHMADFAKENPSLNIRDNEEILEDEFANDPEVQNCMLSPEDIARKEKLWVNENKSWLRQQQIKAYQKRMAANGPPKRTRNRKKMVRIGEGQTSPASSAGEAAVSVLKQRALSKKINYNTIGTIFDDMDLPGGGALGSAATSRVTSRAGSSVPDSPSGSESLTNDEGSEMGDEDASDYINPPKPSASIAPVRKPTPPPGEESDEEEDPEDYVEENDAEDSWRKQGNRGIDEGGEEEGFGEEHEDENDFNDMGDIDVFA